MGCATVIAAKRLAAGLGRAVLLAMYLVFAMAPLYWIVLTSLKDAKEIYTFPLRYAPAYPTLESYRKLFSFANFGLYFRNSLVVSLLAAAGALVICLVAGYGLSRYTQRRSKKAILLSLYFTQMVPGFLLMVPLFTMLSKLRWTDNLLVLACLYAAMMVAFGTIMAKSFFDRIPESLEEAALIDGCTTLGALFRVILPVTLPGIVAIYSFAFVNIWNELFLAVILLSSESNTTVPVALNSFISKAGVSWDILSAGIVTALVPTMLVFAVGQKFIIAGLTEGSVKG
jgi:multiple sugar transport system permease protein